MPKSLTAAISSGIRRPLAIKAALQSWLGVPISLTTGSFWSEYSGTGSFTGKRVTVDQALQLSTVWACVRLISQTLATLPLGFYQRRADGSRESATNHDLYEILHNQPNGDMTAVVFWEVVVASMLLWGNAYIEILRSSKTVIGLAFLHPACMIVRRLANGDYEWRYRDGAKERVIPESNMMHIPAFSTDGKLGLSPIAYGCNVFGTSIETDKASSETFEGTMRSPGFITTNMNLSPKQREDLRGQVTKVSADGGVMVFEQGTGFHKLGFDPVSAELLSSRSWNSEEIARWFQVDPAMIGHGGKDSNWGTGLEQKMIWFLTFTLRHWCVRIEQAVRKNLLTPVERQKYWAEFNMEGLLRGDSASRSTFMSTMVNNGLMTRDEGRAKENLPPKGGNAAVLTVQSAMIAIDDMNAGTNSAENEQSAFRMWLDSNVKAEHAETISAINGLRVEMKAPQPITVDARTTVSAPPPANITVNVPEQQPSPINVDARTTVNAPPASDVTVNIPEQKAPDVHVDVAAPVVTMSPPAVTVNIEASDGEKTTTYERDPKTQEIVSSTTKRK